MLSVFTESTQKWQKASAQERCCPPQSSPGALLAAAGLGMPCIEAALPLRRVSAAPIREAAAPAAAAGGLSPRAMRKGLRRGPRRPPGALLPLPAGLLGRLTCGSRPAQDA